MLLAPAPCVVRGPEGEVLTEVHSVSVIEAPSPNSQAPHHPALQPQGRPRLDTTVTC